MAIDKAATDTKIVPSRVLKIPSFFIRIPRQQNSQVLNQAGFSLFLKCSTI